MGLREKASFVAIFRPFKLINQVLLFQYSFVAIFAKKKKVSTTEERYLLNYASSNWQGQISPRTVENLVSVLK